MTEVTLRWPRGFRVITTGTGEAVLVDDRGIIYRPHHRLSVISGQNTTATEIVRQYREAVADELTDAQHRLIDRFLGDAVLVSLTPRYSGDICDLDQGLAVASRAPTPAESVAVEEYRAAYTKAFGHPPLGMHVISDPSNPEGMAVMYRGDLGLCIAKGPDYERKLQKELYG